MKDNAISDSEPHDDGKPVYEQRKTSGIRSRRPYMMNSGKFNCSSPLPPLHLHNIADSTDDRILELDQKVVARKGIIGIHC